MTDRGDRLINALRADPTLMFEVLEALQDEKLAGPWVQSDDDVYKRTRRSIGGKLLAVVSKHPTRNVHPWMASVAKSGDGERPKKNHSQQSVALAWADMRLLERGYVLAGGS